MSEGRVLLFKVTLVVLVGLSIKPLWWLPCLSLAALLFSLLPRRGKEVPDWHVWHPISTSFFFHPFFGRFSRWVRYRKIIGGDSTMVIPTREGAVIVTLDLSKNDLETLLHFVWIRSLLASLQGRPKKLIRKALETVRRFSDRIEIAYLLGSFSGLEAEWWSAGCFVVVWRQGLRCQGKVLPTAGKAFWRVRGRKELWVFGTDGLAPYLPELLDFLSRKDSPQTFAQSVPRTDDMTVCWLDDVPK